MHLTAPVESLANARNHLRLIFGKGYNNAKPKMRPYSALFEKEDVDQVLWIVCVQNLFRHIQI